MEHCQKSPTNARGPLRHCPECGAWSDSGGRLPPEAELAIDERAAVFEYDGGHERTTAENMAAWWWSQADRADRGDK
jgi:hypothetical protein